MKTVVPQSGYEPESSAKLTFFQLNYWGLCYFDLRYSISLRMQSPIQAATNSKEAGNANAPSIIVIII